MRVPVQPARAIALLAAVTVTLVVLSTTLLLWEMRKQHLAQSQVDTVTLAHVLREQAERIFDGADQVLRGVQDRLQTPFGRSLALDSAGVHLLLASRVLGEPQVDLLAVSDAEGRVVNASRDDPQLSASLRGTSYFRRFASGASDALVIDRPVKVGPSTWTLDMARPFTDAQGRFRGVVALTLKVPQAEEILRWGALDRIRRPVAIYLADGTLLTSWPARDNFVGGRPPEIGPDAFDAEGSQVRMVAHDSGDGVRHVYAIARAGSLPVVVSVTADDEIALASWREQALSIGAGAFLVCVFTVIAASILSTQLQRNVRLARALDEAESRYRHTLESIMDAIVAVDERLDIILFNPAAERMFGMPAAQALGAPLRRLVPAAARQVHDGLMRDFIAHGESRAPSHPRNRNIYGLRADGTEFPMEATLSLVHIGGRPQVTAVLRDVTQQRRAEAELEDSNAQLRALSASLQDVREQERRRIAAELHDELGQQLTGLKLELSWLGGRMKDGRSPGLAEVDSMRHQLDAAIGSVRRIAMELRPRLLDDLGFGAALSWHTGEFSRRTRIDVDVELPAAARVTGEALATGLFRIVQESLTNAARHAGASHVQVRLQEEGGELVLTVQDDGRGMSSGPGARAGLGLVGMRERAVSLGGRMHVESSPGQGTRVEVRVPLAPAGAAASLQEASA